MSENKKTKMLLIIDPQYDFLEGGNLPINGATQIMDNLTNYVKENEYDIIIMTCDWHPSQHISFKTWNPHCVQFTHGASIYKPLFDAVENTKSKFKVLTKGNLINKEEYSIMDNYESSKKLLRFIEMLNVKQIDVCGIASDFCVKSSVEGLINAKLSGKLKVLMDYVVKIESHEPLLELCRTKGIKTA